jgi:Carboxypeptidase regulatory-like domain
MACFDILAACFFGVSCPAFGQSLTSGGVAGTVTDPSGAAVPNATVTLKNNDTGAAASVTSNDTGAYRFALLNPGSYTVSVAAPGFSGVHSERVSCRRTVIHGERET